MSSRLIVNSIRHTGASGDAVTLANDGTCIANITNRSNRNLIINGAMNIAQRGTSSTSNGYQTVDRITCSHYGTNESPTRSQSDVASGTPAYQAGFRKAFKLTNGNQTATDAGDHIQIDYFIESQDLSKSGWNYTSSSSYVTLSFWIKSSVGIAYPFTWRAPNGSAQVYNMSTGTLTADTWTKVTKTIPGNPNMTINNDNAAGVRLMFFPYVGTTYTTNGLAMDTWSAWSNPKHGFEMATTWWTTDDATFEITGLQLEVGDTATDFEHRSYAQELALCQRYYETSYPTGYSAGHNFNEEYPFNTSKPVAQNYIASDDTLTSISYPFMVNKRASPTVTTYSAKTGASGNAWTYKGTGGTNLNVALNVIQTREQQMMLGCSLGAVNQANEMYFHYTANSEL